MKTYDLAVVGSGMGGSLIASLNKNKNIIVFEKDSNLGGCASTFKRFGNYYNSGATTLVGYEKNHPLKQIFDKANVKLDLEKSDIAIRIMQNGNKIDRIKNFEDFIEELNKVFPNKNNRKFWQTLKNIDEKFWNLKDLYYCKYGFNSYLKTLGSLNKILLTYKFDLFKSAKTFIKETLGEISQEYYDFIDSQLLITLQTTSENIPLLSLALGLTYPFHEVYHVKGGMGCVFEQLLKDIQVNKNEEIKKIIKENQTYKIISKNNTYRAKNVILNCTVFDSYKLFEDKQIKDYYNKFSFNDQSAFVTNMTLKTEEKLLHHYQIILNKNIPNCISKAFFISISSQDDIKMSKNGLSITISTHTKASFWNKLSKEEYKVQKQIVEEFLVKKFLENFKNIKKEDIIVCFSGTSKTFNKFINRTNCGGKAFTFKSLLDIPSCKTPFKGLFSIGDTIFPGQGWPGIALGVKVLNKELNG